MQKRHYPLVPVVNIVLKVVAVAALLFFGYISITAYISAVHSWFNETPQQSMFGMQMAPAVKGFMQRLLTLIQPTLMLLMAFGLSALAWGLSNIVHAVREIEFRTRPVIEKAPEAVDTAPEKQSVSA